MAVARSHQRVSPDLVYQFLVVLPKTETLIWRRIEVPGRYSFWDLHVAIQDAMGWLDCHLHEFTLIDPKTQRVKRIGIPDEDGIDDRPCLAGWKVPLDRYLHYGIDPIRYRYDFGDDWEHVLELEDMFQRDEGAYPRCTAGAGACPPEDVGGPHGYSEFLRALQDATCPEHESMVEWVGRDFDPVEFTPSAVCFSDPRERWTVAFGGESG